MRIDNVAVIDHLEVDFEAGLNLVTGETGAGKSILIDALGLVLGNRASSELVRTGAESAYVEAGFEMDPIPEFLDARLREAGIEAEHELVIRREISKAGRGKIVVNGVGSSRALLRDISTSLVDIHGQGDNLALLRRDAGIELLDSYGGLSVLRGQVADAFAGVESTRGDLERLERVARERSSRREHLEFELGELDKAELVSGEDEELASERKLLTHAEKLKELSERSYASLYENEGSVVSRLAQVFQDVEQLASIDARWQCYLDERDALTGQLEDLALNLRDYREEIQVAPGKLDTIETRLTLLDRLKKKHGGTLDAVLERQESVRAELLELSRSSEKLEELRQRLDAARGKYHALAAELSKMRKNSAKRLEKAVAKELPSLALEKARFAVEMREGDWRVSGVDVVGLLFSANPGEELRALGQVVSGGELSRFMLALKAVSAKDETSKVLVFDEVDAGIGGRVADAVGEKLKELATLHQVICVTHLPQIASFAPSHYRIDKIERRGRIETRIERLDSEARVDEIARMLAGAVVTESARAHARQLVTDKSH
ncbi:MAG: DNA repair protein RecN [Acidobacteria bacterium]|nr:MAG: DNA repair protein RecN [Acidobacteriota bacterium]